MNPSTYNKKLVSENWPVVRDELKKSAIESFATGNSNSAVDNECKWFSCGFVSNYLLTTTTKTPPNVEVPAPSTKSNDTLMEFIQNQITDVELSENTLQKNISKLAATSENVYKRIFDLPDEWNVIQIGQLTDHYMGYALKEDILTNDSPIKFTLFRYIGSERLENRALDLVLEFKETGDKSITSIAYEISNQYKRFSTLKEDTELFATYIKDLTALQTKLINDIILWLGPWITLFSGKTKNSAAKQLEQQIFTEVDEFVNDCGKISDENVVLLKLIARRIDLLNSDKIKEAAFQLAQNQLQQQNIAKFLAQLKLNHSFEPFDYYPCILIIDEILDQVPWEMVLPQQEFTRFNSIHLLLHSYELYKDKIDDGYVKLEILNGSALINPGSDGTLQNMSKRMNNFYKKWRPDFHVISDQIPTQQQIHELIQNYDVYVYSGHGSGLQFFDASDDIKIKSKSVLFLFGCESLALKMRGLVSEAFGSPHVYYTIDCPGMLGAHTIITDTYADLVTLKVLMQWIPTNYDRTEVIFNEIGPKYCTKKWITDSITITEPSLLTILCKIRDDNAFTIRMRSALVFRGLPIYNLLAESVKENTKK